MKGSLIARIPSRKNKSSYERLPDSQNSIVKKEKSSYERLPDSQNSIVKKEKFA
jgi:hypothetical protein